MLFDKNLSDSNLFLIPDGVGADHCVGPSSNPRAYCSSKRINNMIIVFLPRAIVQIIPDGVGNGLRVGPSSNPRAYCSSKRINNMIIVISP
ncbi:MAG: hypothetical protein II200_02755, partial [Bacteroidaceae bacterium]|nr:hypothetical protein [Bacteroidaceae bacterium]